jgi:hypothetical protein
VKLKKTQRPRPKGALSGDTVKSRSSTRHRGDGEADGEEVGEAVGEGERVAGGEGVRVRVADGDGVLVRVADGVKVSPLLTTVAVSEPSVDAWEWADSGKSSAMSATSTKTQARAEPPAVPRLAPGAAACSLVILSLYALCVARAMMMRV